MMINIQKNRFTENQIQILKNKKYQKWLKIILGTLIASIGLGKIIQNVQNRSGQQFHSCEYLTDKQKYLEENLQYITVNKQQSLLENVMENIGIILRMIRLGIFFLPTVLLGVPLYFWNPQKYEDFFLSCLAFGIKNSGSVIIKLAQYGSHRPDIFNEKFINKFKHLRVDAPQHSYEATVEILTKNNLIDKIEGLQKKPIASGVIGQVYEANYLGNKVAIKVRHPQVMEKIKQDLQIVFGVSQFLSKFSFFNQLEMPLTIHDFMKVLIDQTDFRIENYNLDKFNQNFKNMKGFVDFPKGIYSSQDVIIQSFIEKGQSISDFISQNKQSQNIKLARLGVDCIYKMVIYDNFVHADCHGGNIFVQKIENFNEPTYFEKKLNKLERKIYNCYNKLQYFLFNFWIELEKIRYNKGIKDLNISDSVSDLKRISKEMKLNDQRDYSFEDDDEQYKLILLDTGMVTYLNENNHIDLIHLLKSVIVNNPQECCEAIKNIAISSKPQQLEQFQIIMKPTFDKIRNTPLNRINVGQIVQDIIFCAQKCHIKFEGNMATLLQNIIVLEGLARELDPDINIIGQAAPFLVSPNIFKKLVL